MRIRFPKRLLIGFGAAFAVAIGLFTIAVAQDDDRSAFIRFVEQQISTPEMQIRLGEIDGVLSSDVTISSISISDSEGAWLTLENVHLVWSRLALLTGTLDVDLLEADRILLPRLSQSDDAVDSSGFEVPELPVEVLIDELAVPRVEIGEPVFGQAATLSVAGNMTLSDGSLQSSLNIDRLDKGGNLALEVSYGNETQELALRLELSEPEDGVIANLLSIEGRPAVSFVIDGSGPLNNFASDVTLTADGTRLFGGPAVITSVDDGFRFIADLNGGLERLVAPELAGYFGSDSRIAIDATRLDSGAVEIATLELRTGVALITASGGLTPDYFPTRFSLDARLGNQGGDRVPLPGLSGASVDSAKITASLGNLPSGRWIAEFDLHELKTSAFNATRARILAGGVATDMADPAARNFTFELSGNTNGLSSDDPDIAPALGAEIQIAAQGDWAAGGPANIRDARVANGSNTARFVGTIGAEELDGTYLVTARDLSLFSGIAGRDLGGGIDLRAMGALGRSGKTFDLHLDASASDLEVGQDIADRLFDGRTTIRGGLLRDNGEFGFSELVLANDQATATLNGTYGEAAAELNATARIGDMSLVDKRIAGAASLRAEITGGSDDRAVAAAIDGDGLRLMGRPFGEAAARIDGRKSGADMNANVTLSGNLDGVPIRASGLVVSLEDGTRAVRSLELRAAQNVASGDLSLLPGGLYSGEVSIDAPLLDAIAPLLLAEASGAITAQVRLSAENGEQFVDIEANAMDARYDTYSARSALIDLTAENVFSVPSASGRVEAQGVEVGEFSLNSMAATFERDDAATTFDARAEFEQGTFVTGGALRPADTGGFTLALDNFDLDSELGDVRLASPAAIRIVNGNYSFETLSLAVADGRIDITGEAGANLDLRANIANVPLAIANAVAPYLKASGRISGELTATGSISSPEGRFNFRGSGISAAPLQTYGIDDLDINASGTFADGTANIQASTEISGGRVNIDGRVGKVLDVNANFSSLPLRLVNAVAPDLDLSGEISGRVNATGSFEDPNAEFSIEGRDISAAPLRDAGLPPLTLRANGSFSGNTVRLTSADFTGSGMSARASGTVPLDGRGLDLEIVGNVPLSITDQFLIDQGARLSGSVRADVRITGSLNQTNVTGNVSGSGIAFADPGSGISVRDISVAATFDGDRATITRLTGNLGRGTVSISGTVAMSSGYPVDLAIALRNARYEDGRLVAATLSGDLTLRGALTEAATLGGIVRVERAEISVPESLPASATMLDVEHRNAPRGVLATLQRAGIGSSGRGRSAGSPSAIVLDLTVLAPARVFVRGRGIDAELGGQLTLTGTVSNIRPVGSFNLRRGRIDILGKRITFSRGELTLLGDLNPTLDFTATTRGDTVTVTITVTGSASDPEVNFSSSPELPEDEVLSQLLFGRGIDQLSPLQLAQLGAAAAQLAGGGGAGILDQLRAGTGLDNLDVTTDSAGNVAVEAGRYVSENVYLGVKGSQESSGVTINLDITEGLTARAEAGQRDSKIGIFYEREY